VNKANDKLTQAAVMSIQNTNNAFLSCIISHTHTLCAKYNVWKKRTGVSEKNKEISRVYFCKTYRILN